MAHYVLWLLMALGASPLLAEAPKLQAIADFYPLLEQYLHQNLPPIENARVEIKLRALDPRTQVATCTKSVEVFTPFGTSLAGQRITLGIKCEEPHWQLYIPAQVSMLKQVVVARRHLAAREILKSDALQLQDVNISSIHGNYFDDLGTVIGKQTKQSIRAGQVISTQHIIEPKIIHKGQTVSILAHRQQFLIRSQGKALNDGSLGQRIQVQNLSSQRTIEGLITGPSEVTIE